MERELRVPAAANETIRAQQVDRVANGVSTCIIHKIGRCTDCQLETVISRQAIAAGLATIATD